MLSYLVEFMEGDVPMSSRSISATSPFMAATMASGRDMTFIGDRSSWVRVTPPGRMPFEYSYAKNFGH